MHTNSLFVLNLNLNFGGGKTSDLIYGMFIFYFKRIKLWIPLQKHQSIVERFINNRCWLCLLRPSYSMLKGLINWSYQQCSIWTFTSSLMPEICQKSAVVFAILVTHWKMCHTTIYFLLQIPPTTLWLIISLLQYYSGTNIPRGVLKIHRWASRQRPS